MRPCPHGQKVWNFYSRPCGRGDRSYTRVNGKVGYFYSRPCGRGDKAMDKGQGQRKRFLLTPLREGRLGTLNISSLISVLFLLTPLREGRLWPEFSVTLSNVFLLTPLREGRLFRRPRRSKAHHFYSRPCGRGDHVPRTGSKNVNLFLLTPLREGRHNILCEGRSSRTDFYSRPCGRGDSNFPQVRHEVLRQIAER